MNKAILTLLLFCFAVFTAGAQVENTKANDREKIDKARAAGTDQVAPEVKNPNAPVIKFDKMVHDYGTLEYQADGNCEFTFTNEGKEPLILTNVKAS
jgi:hypothetical protein